MSGKIAQKRAVELKASRKARLIELLLIVIRLDTSDIVVLTLVLTFYFDKLCFTVFDDVINIRFLVSSFLYAF